MKPHFFLHAGLHKTGSTSVQNTLTQADMPDHHYLCWGHQNHSGAFRDAFADGEQPNKSRLRTGETLAEAQTRIKQMQRARLSDEIKQVTKPNVIFSGEALGLGRSAAPPQAFADFLAPHASGFTVVAYVRPPISFKTSLFCHLVMADLAPPANGSLFFLPTLYRSRLGYLDRAFGQENVELRKFDRDALIGGDVVLDIADMMGVTLNGGVARESNVSLPAEALSVLFACRQHFDPATGRRNGMAYRTRFRGLLRSLGATKLRFDPDWVLRSQPDLDEDAGWMEQRLGVSMAEDRVSRPGDITSREDLLYIAVQQAEPLAQLLEKRVVFGGEAARVAVQTLKDATLVQDNVRRVATLVQGLKLSVLAECRALEAGPAEENEVRRANA